MVVKLTEDDRAAVAKPDVKCTNCTAELRPEHALLHDGEPFCDEFCHGMYATNQANRGRSLHGTRDVPMKCVGCAAEIQPGCEFMHNEMPFCSECAPRMTATTLAPIEAVLHGPADAKDSIKVARNAKGEYSWEIKVYFDSNADGAQHGAIEAIKQTDMKLRGDYLRAASK